MGTGILPCPSSIKLGFAPSKRLTTGSKPVSKLLGYIFHGTIPNPESKRGGTKAGTNLLHFARCPKLDKVTETEARIWFRTIVIAKLHLDETVGANRWKWCKLCEREITQRILNER